jgi:hypothetical protein
VSLPVPAASHGLQVTWNFRLCDPSWAQAEAEFLHKELLELFEGKGLQVGFRGESPRRVAKL